MLRSLQNEFISSISHDLRTPLAAIKASVGVVLENEPTGTSEALHRLLVNIDSAADDLSEMVANLLELARLQAHGGELHLAWFDLRQLGRRAVEAIEPMAKRKDQKLEAHLPNAPVWGQCDGNRVERAICNLLGNARKYAPAGTTVRLSLLRRGGAGVFAVTDEGPGIPPEDQARLLVRGDSSDGVPARAGSGLGLPVARTLAELHGGHLSLESAPGHGATFRLILPLRTENLEIDVEAPRRRTTKREGHAKMTTRVALRDEASAPGPEGSLP
jgi:signal transduction histidine kinase